MKNKISILVTSAIVAIILLIIGIFIGKNFITECDYLTPHFIPPQKACTMEAKICSDGSAVGRTGPNCEFSLCPDKE